MKVLIMGLICAFLISVGQVFWKLALIREQITFSKYFAWKELKNLAFSPYMILGIIIYFIATILWIYLLNKFEYSKIYPIIASAYVYAILFSYLIFKENIGMNKIIGILFIIGGIIFISKG